MPSNRILHNRSVLRSVFAVGGASVASRLFAKPDANFNCGQQDGSKDLVADSILTAGVRESLSSSVATRFKSALSLLDPKITSLEGSKTTSTRSSEHQYLSSPTKSYDFIIIGHGNAGQSALRTLRERCPRAKIAVVDPLRSASSRDMVEHVRETVTGFDPKTKTVQLLTGPESRLQYRHGVLIATGARGAPPPLELFAESSLSRVLELRTTELVGNCKRPVLAPDHVRAAVMATASKGGKVAILGSGWEALDLVCAAERFGKKKPTIVFGLSGPAWNLLPQYLSSELRKKLLKRDVDILDRSVVRYVADVHRGKSQKLELHTAKVYDLLETRRTLLDLLVVAPDTFGTKGTAALPTSDIPDRMKESSDGRPWYKTWSQLTKTSLLEPSVVICFGDDGRIAVNAELSVASKIYAAGSVAKYPNSSTGQASIAGEGSLNGTEAGRVAAINMSRSYQEKTNPFSYGSNEDAESFATHSLPVWRSDVASYPGKGTPVVSSLSTLGVQALCVGQCDSERLATRAFWWTNSSAQRKVNKLIDDEEELLVGSPDPVSQHRTNRRRLSRQRRRLGFVTPIYGIGVVFYLDNNGRIRGIMTWGLPFADDEGGNLNPKLLEAIQLTILRNAGIPYIDAEENHQIMNTAMAKASQHFVSLAMEGQFADATVRSHFLDGPIDKFSTPLYRYTEVGPANSATLRVLKRKEGLGLGVLGEDLYARDELPLEQKEVLDEDQPVPANIPVTNYPVTVVPFQLEASYGSKAASLGSLLELNQYLAVQRGWEENENRARPGKEDPLWLRPGDERKQTSRKQMIIDAYRSILYPGRT